MYVGRTFRSAYDRFDNTSFAAHPANATAMSVSATNTGSWKSRVPSSTILQVWAAATAAKRIPVVAMYARMSYLFTPAEGPRNAFPARSLVIFPLATAARPFTSTHSTPTA